MQNNDFRAKQFMPFDSLKGFYEMIRYEEKIKNDKKTLSEDSLSYLNEQLNQINKGDIVSIEYYYNEDYIRTNGSIKKIDKINKCIYILNSKINFDDILNISKRG